MIDTIALGVTAIFTGLVAVIAWTQLSGTRKIAQATFVRDFTKNFTQPATKFLFALCENDALEFKTRSINGKKKKNLFPYFTFDKEIVKQIDISVPEDFRKNNRISYRVADDILLVYLEDIGLFFEEGLVSEKMLYESWGFCIVTVWENKAIIEYIKWWKKNKTADTYDKFELAYLKCKGFEAKKKTK